MKILWARPNDNEREGYEMVPVGKFIDPLKHRALGQVRSNVLFCVKNALDAHAELHDIDGNSDRLLRLLHDTVDLANRE